MKKQEKISVALLFILFLTVAIYEYRVSVKQIPATGNKRDEKALFQGVSSYELQEMINRGEEFTLVDIRSERRYRKGHIPGAVSIEFTDIEAGLNKLDRSRTIILYDESGPWSRIAYKKMKEKGFKNLRVLNNGIVGWKWEVSGEVVKSD